MSNNIIMDYRYLKYRIKQKYATHKEFAADLGISQQTLSSRLNNRSEFTIPEFYRITDLLGIETEDEIHACFFMHSNVVPFRKKSAGV